MSKRFLPQDITGSLTPIRSYESESSTHLPTYAQFNSIVRKSLDVTSPIDDLESEEHVRNTYEVPVHSLGVSPSRPNIYSTHVEDDRLIDNLDQLRSEKRISVDVSIDNRQTVFQVNEIISGMVILENRSKGLADITVVYIQLQGWLQDYKFLSMVHISPETTCAINLKPREKRQFEFKFKVPEQKILINDQVPLHANMYPSWEATDLETHSLGVPIAYLISCHVVGLYKHSIPSEYFIMGEMTLPIQLYAIYPPLELFVELEYNEAICTKLKTHLIWINKQNIEKWTEPLFLKPSRIDLKIFSIPDSVTIRHVSPLHPIPTQKLRIPINIHDSKAYNSIKADLVAVTVKSPTHIPIILTHSMFYRQMASSHIDYSTLVSGPLKQFIGRINKIGSHFETEEILAIMNDSPSTSPTKASSLSNLIVDDELSANLDTLINLKVAYTTLPFIKPKITPTLNGLEIEINLKFLHLKGKDIAVASNRFGMEGFQLILDFQGCHAARLYYLSLELGYASKFLVHLYLPVKIS
ncbi:uncharacterized protein KQ657_000090 [Scheffersomyces spartinae]|uniref:Uncharacterized protein n=1 Tax=Scheffersomyces spartinae TaxID=45513 RepID=A0A9P7VDD7_9ASCO|nr:uncharacterized protein KQ657_000090 [Scheffersomyces spartinae]KAG7196078.1 hypothetical protein KQ657_000090 [Scheffersomyces spartinae]